MTAVDQHAAASGSGSTFSSGSTGTISRSGEFVFAVVARSADHPQLGSGLNQRADLHRQLQCSWRAYRIPSATGTFAASGTGSGTWLAEIATFQWDPGPLTAESGTMTSQVSQ